MAKTLTDRPGRHIGHLNEVRPQQGFFADQTEYRYQTFPVDVRRPDEGATIHDVTCVFCGAPLWLRLESRFKTVWSRRGWLLLSVVGVLVLGFNIIQVSSSDSVMLRTAPLAIFSVVTSVASVNAIVTGLIYYGLADGTRLLPSKHRGAHRLVYPVGKPEREP